MKKRNFVILFLAVSLFAACHINSSIHKTRNTSRQTATNKSNISYKIANNYFVNNDIKQLPPTKITNNEEFEKYFGAAAFMGKNGQPTEIDFEKEYVICVVKPETEYSTTLSPLSLRRDAKGNIIFAYKAEIGQRQTYSIVPCLLIVLSNSVQGQVILREE